MNRSNFIEPTTCQSHGVRMSVRDPQTRAGALPEPLSEEGSLRLGSTAGHRPAPARAPHGSASGVPSGPRSQRGPTLVEWLVTISMLTLLFSQSLFAEVNIIPTPKQAEEA